jgi:poly-beta-1,6-N-acetyl-D-glucosamine synthase
MSNYWECTFWVCAAVITYTHLGYWLLLQVFRMPRSSGRPVAEMDLPSVTLIIPAYNEELVLQRKLENSLALEYPEDRFEILVVSDGSSDCTVSIARGFAHRGVRLLAFQERRGKMSVVNAAVQIAGGDVLCLCDANVMFRPDALRRLVENLADPRVGAASGDVQLASQESNFGHGESVYYRMERMLQHAESHVGSMIGVDGGLYVMRRELYRPLPADTILDDFVTTMRVIRQGKRVVFDPRAVASENATPTAWQECLRRVRVAAGAVQSLKRCEWPALSQPIELWQYVSHKLLRWMGPAFFTVLLASNVMLLNSGLVYQVAFGLQCAVYLLAITGGASLRFRRTRVGGIVFYFVLSHIAIAAGVLKGLLNLQPAAWQRTERSPMGRKVEASPLN